MRKSFFIKFLGIIFFILGCAEKPMANSVIDLAGNQIVAGWSENKENVEKTSSIKVSKSKVDNNVTKKDEIKINKKLLKLNTLKN